MEHERTECSCGTKLRLFGVGQNWGDFKCPSCGTAYCQDCGEQLNMNTMQCLAYEAMQAEDGEA